MKLTILVAPDSFKDCLAAVDVAEAIASGLSQYPDINVLAMPMADGGEGTVDALVSATGGRKLKTEVIGPLGDTIMAQWAILGDNTTAVIEMASASGLMLVPEASRNPAVTTTFGTGQLIAEAINKGCQEIIVGIGGSATNDGGLGMAQALGVSVRDLDGHELGYGGRELSKAVNIDISNLHPGLKNTKIKVACDVNNPLFGQRGAAYIYAPQKGAEPELVESLDINLRHWAEVIRSELGQDVAEVPGAGAAGGLGAGLIAFTNAQLVKGIELVMDTLEINRVLEKVDLVVTGEGRFDAQTASGKVAAGLASRAKQKNIPVVVVAGSVDMWKEAPVLGIDAVFSICKGPITSLESMNTARELLIYTGAQIGGLTTALLNLNNNECK
ncbi:glycerate kinase [Metallumcola ferriviriculae]|uniref:Glycerate kinase n=1 Tax=Metallumcola ferriviriculae TaxID=3039180 RepID=A0AAU0UR10_9FIRM|nr:glycerate kinase [Desulfitibacteraceae bacterium MK1]